MKKNVLSFSFALILLITLVLGCQSKIIKKYEPTWESLKEAPIPQWYEDAKFGIMIHWGPYSVLAEIPETSKGNYAEHSPSDLYRGNGYDSLLLERFGAMPPDFGYKDMIPMFTGEKFNAEQWLDLFEKAGAKYIIPVAEHHDGFAMWDSKLTTWDAKDKGPKRDVIGELAIATRKKGLKFAPSIHRERHNTYYSMVKNEGGGPLPVIAEEIKRVPEAASLYGPFEMNDEYMIDFLARWQEICDKYQPDFYWLDDYPKYDSIDRPLFMKYQRRLIANYINQANSEWGKEVYFNNKGRNNNYPDGVGIREYDNMQTEDYSVKWQNPATLGTSYGYRKIEELQKGWMKPPRELIHLLVEVVSKNGNLLMNVGPRPDGTIPEVQQESLMAIGDWLKVNGDAIYDTRVWKTVGEGRMRFTAKNDTLYATLLEWPKDGSIVIRSLNSWKPKNIKSVRLLGDQRLAHELIEEGLKIDLPNEPIGKYAYVLEISCNQNVQNLPFNKHENITEDLHLKHKKRIMGLKKASEEASSTDYQIRGKAKY